MGSTDEKTSIADQIAAEAAKVCADNVGKVHGIVVDESLFKQAIKSACEKAREPLLVEIKTAINENDMMPLFMALDECDEIKFSRAAHASEIDPVSGYRYDQEIPEPICEMQQIETSSPVTENMGGSDTTQLSGQDGQSLVRKPSSGGYGTSPAHNLQPAHASEQLQDARNLWNVAPEDSHQGWIQQMQENIDKVKELQGEIIEMKTARELASSAAHASEPWTVNTILQICDNAGVMLPTDNEAKAIADAHNATLSQHATPVTDASKQNPQCPTCGQRVPDSLLEKIVDAVMEPAAPATDASERWTKETVRQLWRDNQINVEKNDLYDEEVWDSFFQRVADAHTQRPTPATHVCDQGFGCPVCAATQDPQTKEKE